MSARNKGRFAAFLTAIRMPIVMLGLLLTPALSACTTAEGTNALVNPATFEREVMTSTLQGLDIVPQDEKKADGRQRAPLVMPKQTAQLPAPTTRDADAAALPEDTNNPKISTAGLSDDDLKHLRNARVVDLHSVEGRPLTDIERRQMAARMRAANTQVADSSRPLTLSPENYFTSYKGKDAICAAKDGTLVPLNDKRCPAEVRNAMRKQAPVVTSVTTEISREQYDMRHGIDPNQQK